jgi:hypothetical protein
VSTNKSANWSLLKWSSLRGTLEAKTSLFGSIPCIFDYFFKLLEVDL